MLVGRVVLWGLELIRKKIDFLVAVYTHGLYEIQGNPYEIITLLLSSKSLKSRCQCYVSSPWNFKCIGVKATLE